MSVQIYKNNAWQDIAGLKAQKDGVYADVPSAKIDVAGAKQEVWPELRQKVNYLMLYDFGNECTDVTGGWVGLASSQAAYSTVEKHSDNMFVWAWAGAAATFDTQNVINISAYSKLYGLARGTCKVYRSGGGAAISIGKIESYTTPTNNVTPYWFFYGFNDESHRNEEVAFSKQFLSVSAKGQNNAHIRVIAFGGGDPGVSQVYVYAIFLVKADDTSTLAQKAGITDTTISGILAKSSQLLSNKSAVAFMLLQCTGEFMVEAIQNATFKAELNNSPYKADIYANPHWAKFLAMAA